MRPRPEDRGEPPRRSLALAQTGFNAATARRPWRTHASLGLIDPRRASMRPRPEGRGERRFVASTTIRSSMLQCGHGPKAVENGSRATPDRGEVLQCGHGPRPWRTHRICPSTLVQSRASMRPRPEGRGERGQPRWSRHGDRRSFNAATARRPWRTRAGLLADFASGWLQCGHGPKTVENSSVRRQTLDGRASMRPRPEDRGEPRVGFACMHGLTASMRPRPEDRGERAD